MEYTPQELSAILFYNNQQRESEFKMDWEKTRIQTFFLVSIHIPKNNHFSYTKFKNEIWQFPWDRNRKHKDNPTEGIMPANDWQNIIKKLT